MHVMDIVVERDEDQSGWHNVSFLGEGGELVVVRLELSEASDAGAVEQARLALLNAAASASGEPTVAEPEIVSGNVGGLPSAPRENLSLEEEADNAYQNPDEALPDDREARAIDRNPGKQGSRFDEV